MKNLQKIKDWLLNSESDKVIEATEKHIHCPSDNMTMAEIYYMRGNAFRQKGEWENAMNCYLSAIELNPESPAVEAYRTAQQILEFYNKDYYNP